MAEYWNKYCCKDALGALSCVLRVFFVYEK